ncbi:cytokine receptor [Plodia interpunctella]|uniref:cytokine receptor n=1 Tax=Plodia interpunctella TaxID=58824 RepID=UPI0023686423|nr:cytokine receptor [Plodia interpunctella]
MAYHLSIRRTIKYSVSIWSVGMWFRCIILVCLIRLPGTLSRCYPPGRADVLYGDPLELFCIAENPDDPDYNPEDLKFSVGTIVINDTELVNSTTRRLYVRKPEKSVRMITYQCQYKNDICHIRVLVDTPPLEVTDFGCISYNLNKLRCNWTSAPDIAVIRYNVSVEFAGKRVGPYPAKEVKGSKTNEIYWEWDSAYRQQEVNFNIILNATTQFGSTVQQFNIDHFAIVKPDPPSNLQVLINKSHQVKLQWEIPNTMVDLLACGVEHRIEYQIAKIDHTKDFHSVNASMLPRNNKTYMFWLKNLPYAHMQYEVKIYIKSRKAVREEFWSNYSYIVFTTASERPRRPPGMIAGAFSETEFESRRKVMIYWRQLEEYEEAGANFTYMVNVTHSDKTMTLYPYKNNSLSYVILDNVPWKPMQVSVASLNEKGLSPYNSHLYIPPKADSSLKVTKFSQIAFEGNIYKLSWIGFGESKIDNYTLFWCQHNITNICTGRLNFTVLESNKTSHKITLPRRDRYQFAISANRGLDTSGIVWATCDISNDTLLMYNFPVEVGHGPQGKTHVSITWSLTCSIHLEPNQTTIKGYKITYCIVLKTTNECDPAYNKTYVNIPNPRQMQKNITNLLPFKTYLFTLSLETHSGWKNLENASTATTTTEDTPTSPRNVNVTNITSDSVVLSFDPPDPRNGIIGNYKIYNYSDLLKVVDVVNDSTDTVRRNVTITGLQGFTTYSFTVKACNTGIKVCSEESPHEPIVITTKIGPPAQLKPPQVIQNPDQLLWHKPDPPGGNITYYEIRVVKDNNEKDAIIYSTYNRTYKVAQCADVRFGETYQVRAVNRDGDLIFPGEWSEPSHNNCRFSDNTTMVLIFVTLFALLGIGYGCMKLYQKYKDMDIKPVMPEGLIIPEPDKFQFAWNSTNKDNKPSNDETLPLTTKVPMVSLPEVKQNDNSNCNTSDRTTSTAMSESSQGHVDRQPSTSDDDSNSSLNLEVDAGKVDDSNNDDEYSNSDNDSFRDPFNDKPFKVKPQPVRNPNTGYVQSVPAVSVKNPQLPPVVLKNPGFKLPPETASSSYVKAGLSPSIFTTGVVPPPVKSHPPTSSGYVLRDDAQAELPNMRPPPSIHFGPTSLPTMPALPQPAKHGVDSSYIQLQSLDSLPSLKQTDRNIVPSQKPTAPSLSPGDGVINKHLNNLMSAGQMAEEPAILDPKMSPDAYCRFSWSTDPANDNLQSLYSPATVNSFKN